MSELKIGMVALDTSHVVAFAKCFNKTDHAEHIAGARVTVAFPGGSPDFDLSINRVAGFTKQLNEEFGVKIVDSPEAVAEHCDLLFLMSSDGRIHRQHFEKTVRFKRPTFIDKPFATTSADAEAIVEMAKKNDVPVMSCSSLRYAHTLTEALAAPGEMGAIVGCDVFGPMSIAPPIPGLFWYGIHSVEMINRIMGRGAVEVTAATNADYDVLTISYKDGRFASLRGIRKGHSKFGATIHREKGFQFVDASGVKKSYYASMLEAIMASLPKGKGDIDPADTLEVIRILEAANRARETGRAAKV